MNDAVKTEQIKSVGIIVNEEKDSEYETTACCVRLLSAAGVCSVLTPGALDALQKSASYKALQRSAPADGSPSRIQLLVRPDENPAAPSDVAFLLVIGGDGTILSAAKKYAHSYKPILGVNRGKLGFLATVERGELASAVTLALNGEYTVEHRMMITAAFADSGGEVGKRSTALNDIVITREGGALASLSVFINGEAAQTYSADGIIISTPTGSTAYNLSAGGPILQPMSQMLALTPICPHTLYSRPWVIPATDTVRVEAAGEVVVFADGIEVKGELPVTITRAVSVVALMRVGVSSFYEVLDRKMLARG